MAHRITNKDKGAIVRESAWHGLFQVLSDFMTAAQAMVLAGLDWDTNVVPSYFLNTVTGAYEAVPGSAFSQRSDTGAILGPVNEDYQPIHNSSLRRSIERIFGIDAKVVESAFSLDGGATVVLLVNLGEVEIGLKMQGKTVADGHKRYLMIATNHVSKGGYRYLETDVRVVCNNTLTAAEGYDGSVLARDGFTVRHSRNAEDRINACDEAYAQAVAAGDLNLKRIQHLADLELTPAAKLAFYQANVDVLAPVLTDADITGNATPDERYKVIERRSNKRARMMEAFLAWDKTEAETYGVAETTNAYVAFNVVSNYLEHQSNFRSSEGKTAAENEFVSRISGQVNADKKNALAVLEQIVADGSNLLAAVLAEPVQTPLEAALAPDSRSFLDMVLSEV